MRTLLNGLALCAAVAISTPLPSQEHPVKRLASIVSVAVDEYGKGIDERGRLVSRLEYQEAVDFLADARQGAARLSGERAAAARGILDSLILAVGAKRSPAAVRELHARFTAALGAEAALEMPKRPIDLAEGRTIYAQRCAGCHGERGAGDGPAAPGMDPAPPPIGTRAWMHDVAPALAYRIVSVGVKGTAMQGFAESLTPEQRWNVVSYVTSLRATPAEVREGEGLFLQRCAGCHGPAGAGDGALATWLTTLPPAIGDFAWQAERSDAQLAAVIRAGVSGSAMPGAPELDSTAVAGLLAYVRSLATREAAVAAAGDDPAVGGEAAARRVATMLDEALAAARAGRPRDAGDRAFDAYIAFEPLETPARARSPGLVATMERHFSDFKGSLRANDLRAAERARDAIRTGLPSVVALGRPTGGSWGAFLASFLIILREGFEAILVVGAVVAFLIKTGHREQLRTIWLGCAAALAASALTAVAIQTALRAVPASREIIEGATMLVAVVVLFSVSYWLISKVEAAKWQRFIHEQVGAALARGGGAALGAVAFLAVYREGAETALFYQALFTEGARQTGPLLLGMVAGFAALAVVFTLFHRYGARLPLRPFFAVTSVLLYGMAFVFAGKGVRELQEGDALPITVVPGAPTVEALGIYGTVETLLAQLVLVLLFVFALAKSFLPRRADAPPAAAARPPLAAELAELRSGMTRLQARLAVLEDRAAGGSGEARGARGADRESTGV